MNTNFGKLTKEQLDVWSTTLFDQAKRPSVFSAIMPGTNSSVVDQLDSSKIRLFRDADPDFTFTQRHWKTMFQRVEPMFTIARVQANAHRMEAIRRVAVCRLSDRPKEADHWHACRRFLENLFKLPEV